MKIRLHQFLCYSDSTFDFGDQGLALLSGPSGSGKTSILRGVFFALFGEGNKLQAYGKTSCRVELEFDGIKIVRTKRPNRLVVDEIYEDDTAQEIINKKFSDTFKTCGYAQQNALNSFILMSPIDKLDFLEKFAFRDVDLGKIKGRCKALISKRHDELLGMVSQLDMVNSVLGEMEPPDEVRFPITCKQGQRERVIKNESVRSKNCNILVRRAEKAKIQVQDEINALRVLEATLQSRKETFHSLEEKLEDLEVEIDDQIYEGDKELQNYEKRLDTCLARRELYIMEEQLENNVEKLEEMKKEEEAVLCGELAIIDGALWKEYSRNELKTAISDLKQCVSEIENVERLRKEIKKCIVDLDKHNAHKSDLENYSRELEEKQRLHDKLLAQKELYSCPACSVRLRLLNEELCIAEDVDEEDFTADLDTVKEDIRNLKHSIGKLQHLIPTEEDKLERKADAEAEIEIALATYEEVPDINGMREDLEYLREYQVSQLELEKKRKEIERSAKTEKFSSSYESFKRSIDAAREQVKELTTKSGERDEEMDEEVLREKIFEQKHTRERLAELEKRRDKMSKEKNQCKEILDKSTKKHITEYGRINDEDKLVEEVQKHEKEIDSQRTKRDGHEKNLKRIEEWQRYQEELENYHSWEVKVEELEKKEKEARNEYAAATQLKDTILEAESIAMLNIIDSINTHARLYLDCFFTEHPISVQLQPFKETKKSTKPTINIAIEYKGMEADMNMLSGGELSRVILAYTLALAEMFNAPLLLLDECTASLDQDLTGVVFNAIRENFNGQMTLVVAHQVVTGTFDKVVRLGPETCSEE